MTQTTTDAKPDRKGSRARPEDAPRPTAAARAEESEETKTEVARPAAYRDWASI